MRNVRRAGPLAGAALVVALTSGCSQAPGGLACDATLEASAEALQGAMTDLVTVSGQMRASLAVACAAIATDLGQTPPDVGDGTMVSDATMQSVCTMATNAIKAAGMSTILIEGGQCQVGVLADVRRRLHGAGRGVGASVRHHQRLGAGQREREHGSRQRVLKPTLLASGVGPPVLPER